MGLEFSGEQIYQNQTNGSFTLSKLSLFEENSGRAIPVSISYGGNLYQTAAYQYLDFQVSPIRIERNGTALGVDTNSNGLFDILRVNLPVNVRQAGAYSWSAVLTDRNGNQIGKTVGSAALNAGSNIAVLNFNARNIGYNGVSGPYVVTGVSIKGGGTSVSDKNVLITPAFASTLFETCTYSVTPAALNVGASSQSGAISVTAETGCYWNVRESSSWLSPFTFGSGTGTLNYFISFNPGEVRSGSISVGRVVIPVNQSSNCTFALSPASPQSVASTGGSLSVNVTTGSTCTWTAASSVPWITVTSGSSGSGNGIASLQIAANVGAARSGSVTIAGQDYVINQAASSSCNYSLSPSSTTISESGGAGNFGVTSNDGCTWSATSNALWITTSSTGSGNGTVTFTVAANSGNARSGSILVAGQAFTVNQSAASSGPIVPVKVSSADSALSDFFGNSVSINGNTAIVGANGHAVGGNDDQGAAYVYVRNGTSWVLQQKLTMPTADAQVAAQFGYSVAISGDTVIVGSPTQDNGGNIDQGAAYVYVRSGTTWTFQQRLRQSDGAAGDNFGWSVAIDGNTAVVGAYLDDESVYTNCGSAYAYLRTGSTWAEESRMVSSERTSNSQMGYSVGISGDTVIIGARLAQSSTSSPDFGSAYIFTPVAGTPRIWTQRSILTAPQRGAGDQFGFSVGVNGNTALIGARFDDVGSNVDQGSAYVFTGSGNTWSFQRQLLANDGIANDEFGNAVSISGIS
ncbi:MAG: hypothetical protein IPJ30_08875 [Acidobacteria bacterium]|nr:hypothetical protein [Acidobacteriota bacterium]